MVLPTNPIYKVLLLDPLPIGTANAFLQNYTVVECFDDLSEPELVKKISDFHVVCLSREKDECILTEEVLRSANRLLAIGVFGSLSNQVDMDTAQLMGIPVFTAPFQHQHSVAELVISQLILLSRQIGDRSKEIHQGEWQKTSNDCHEVRSKTLGIVGYGHAGSQLGVMAEALSIKVIFYDLMALMPIGRAEPVSSVDELLAQSDFVSLHVTCHPDNKHLIGKEQLLKMKKGSLLINNSYGDAVDHEALAEVIKSGHLGGAAIDVFPDSDTPVKSNSKFTSPLQNLRNVILTPAYSHKTTESAQRVGSEITNSVVRYINDGTTSGSMNFPSVATWQLQKGHSRIICMHRNVRGVLREIDNILSAYNVRKQVLDTKDKVGYLIADVTTEKVSTEIVSQLALLANTIRTHHLIHLDSYNNTNTTTTNNNNPDYYDYELAIDHSENSPLLPLSSSSDLPSISWRSYFGLNNNHIQYKCWACWETFNSVRNPLIRVCQGCKDPELQYIHQDCINSYISSLPLPRRPRSPRPSLSNDTPAQDPVLYDCTRCRDPYIVSEKQVSPLIVMWHDLWLRYLMIALTLSGLIIVSIGTSIAIDNWNSDELLMDLFGIQVTVLAVSLFLTVIGTISIIGLWITMWFTCSGTKKLHVTGQPLV
ncbi:D-isomer specific 2-hydroxyacid dehydrogenase [Globomyces pollinis-pini]|nr:D-isomer specific 2-hydroxyacid dehydrogenase [Globomyces pollinis-pini]